MTKKQLEAELAQAKQEIERLKAESSARLEAIMSLSRALPQWPVYVPYVQLPPHHDFGPQPYRWTTTDVTCSSATNLPAGILTYSFNDKVS